MIGGTGQPISVPWRAWRRGSISAGRLPRAARSSIEPEEAKRLVEDYSSWELVVNDGCSILGALDLEARFKVSFWDALILQAATTADVSILYSEDLSHGQLYDGVEVVNPFHVASPAESAS